MEVIDQSKTIGIEVIDERHKWLVELLRQKGYKVTSFEKGEDAPDADVIFYGKDMMEYLKDPEIASENAIATAEGAIAELISLMPVNLEGARVVVMGFGRCGKAIAEKLYCMGAEVSVVARSERALRLAHYFGFRDYPMDADIPFEEMDAVVNTIPALVIDKEQIDRLRHAVILDIASAPGGCNFAYCREKGIKSKLALGLPGIYSPKTSGALLFSAMPFGVKQ